MTLSDPRFWDGLMDQRVAVSMANGRLVTGRVDSVVDHPEHGPRVWIRRLHTPMRTVVPTRHVVAVSIGGDDE